MRPLTERAAPALDVNLRFENGAYSVLVHPIFDGGTDIFQVVAQLEYIVVPVSFEERPSAVCEG